MGPKKTGTNKPPTSEEEIFENFKIDLAELKPEVREKALALANG